MSVRRNLTLKQADSFGPARLPEVMETQTKPLTWVHRRVAPVTVLGAVNVNEPFA